VNLVAILIKKITPTQPKGHVGVYSFYSSVGIDSKVTRRSRLVLRSPFQNISGFIV